MPERFTHGYALLIGVGACSHPAWSLPVAARDARAVRSILVDPDLCAYPGDRDHLRLLHDAGATRAAILDGLAWLRGRAAADPQATALVYYSGHGWLDRARGRYYLVPHDVDPADVPASALPAAGFAAAIRAVPARRLLVLIDSCRAEGMASAKDEPAAAPPPGLLPAALPKDLAADLKQGEGRAVFSSSRGTQRSWTRPDGAMSIYTYHLVEAFQGAANLPGDGLVRLSNLMNHLGRAVPCSARRLAQAEQTPFFDTATEDFPVAVLRGGKGLPAGGWAAVQPEAEETMRRLESILLGDAAVALGEGARAAASGGIVADQVQGPVATAPGAIAAGGHVIFAGQGSQVHIGAPSAPAAAPPAPAATAPAPDAGAYDLAAVRDLLLAAFTAPDLRRLFLYTGNPDLRPLVQRFSPTDGLGDLVDRVIEYCHVGGFLPDLLAEVQRANPRQYARFAPRLGSAPPRD